MLSNVAKTVLVVFVLPHLLCDCLIITTINAGRKKFKTISFDYLLPPLKFVKDDKLQFSFNGHYKLRRPSFKWDVSMPLNLPIEVEHEHREKIAYHPHGDYDQSSSQQEQSSTGEFSDRFPSAPIVDDGNVEHYVDQPVHDQSYHVHDPHIINYVDGDAHQRGQAFTFVPSNAGHGSAGSRVVRYQHHKKIPYTGKAQISSYIENGHLVTAHHAMEHLHERPRKIDIIDEAFEDQLDGPFGRNAETRKHEIKRMATLQLGYGKTHSHPHYLTTHAKHPDSVPLPISRSIPLMSKYYTSLGFSNGLPDYPTLQAKKGDWSWSNLKKKFADFKNTLPVIVF